MKKSIFLALVLVNLFFIFSCKKQNNNENGYESYRYELWKMLIDNGYQFDLIGTQIDDGNYPDYLGNSFDRDHEGIGGIESEDLLSNLSEVLLNVPVPDLVLLCVGGNDLLNGDDPSAPISNIHLIIDVLQNNNPNVTVFIEQIAPAREDAMNNELTNKITSFNNQIISVANNQSNNNSIVSPIDMYTNFSNSFFADDVHYNEQGANFVAGKYLNAIQSTFNNINFINILTLGDSRVEGGRP